MGRPSGYSNGAFATPLPAVSEIPPVRTSRRGRQGPAKARKDDCCHDDSDDRPERVRSTAVAYCSGMVQAVAWTMSRVIGSSSRIFSEELAMQVKEMRNVLALHASHSALSADPPLGTHALS